jgi:4-diphosphocytidyl-2-C-methyl-D-erythritol kinase
MPADVKPGAETPPRPRPHLLLGLPAPAKINLFLHVVGRRADGYHELQSALHPVGLYDTLDFERLEHPAIERTGDLAGPAQSDLAVRAARLLQQRHAPALGVSIAVQKRIPVGAGLGGGSSDAATTLLALNRLWQLGLSRPALAGIGLEIGADVPFFLGPGPAFVQGVGELLEPRPPDPRPAVLLVPQVSVSTAEIFSDPHLTRSTKRTTISGFSAVAKAPGAPLFGANDLEAVARRRAPQVGAALDLLARHGEARMSGSGSAVFCLFPDAPQARTAADALRREAPAQWQVWSVPLLAEHPLAGW